MSTKTGVIVAATGLVLVVAVLLAVQYNDWFAKPKLIEARRAWAVQQMRDPATVQFRNERLVDQGSWLCGELNGKNAYGAYTGFKRFISQAPNAAWVEGSGYMGKPNEASTARLVEELDVRNDVLRSVIQIRKDSGGEVTYTEDQIDNMVESALFDRRWKEVCGN